MRTIVVVLYKCGEEMMNRCRMSYNALDDYIDKELNLPVKHGTEIIGYVKKLYKKHRTIYAKVELIADVAYSIQQMAKRSRNDEIVVTKARLCELYI